MNPEPQSLLDLKPQHCRWPIGRDADARWLFCCAPREGGSAYCAHHRQIAFHNLRREP